MKGDGKTALITGASSGIGLELAKLFAADHYNLVIVARNPTELFSAAEHLREAGSPKVTVIAKDLSNPEVPAEIYNITSEHKIKIDVLVNDAGVGKHGLFTENSLDEELKIIRLNIEALVHLTKLYLRDMVSRGEGRILQLASIASYQPTPKLAVYAATKAFVLSFTDAVREEIEGTGVTMTALIPGPTDTDFFRKAGMENTVAAQNDPEDPAVVAKIGYEALMEGGRHAIAPGMRMQIMMSSVTPNDQVAAMAGKQMEEK